jgi:hypothetical protein
LTWDCDDHIENRVPQSKPKYGVRKSSLVVGETYEGAWQVWIDRPFIKADLETFYYWIDPKDEENGCRWEDENENRPALFG